MTSLQPLSTRLLNIFLSLILYTYFVSAFLLFFVWLYLGCRLFSRNVEASFQRLSHYFYRGFFGVAQTIMPRLEIHVDEDVRSIRSSVIISNHLSYLDPILLIATFARHKTVVKSRFLGYPFFSLVLKGSGYIPSSPTPRLVALMTTNLETLREFLESGGNLFIFPEGTRSRDGKLGPFEKGAFTIARKSRAPIRLIRITDSHRLFPPGNFVFRASDKISIKVECIGTISPETMREADSLAGIIEVARACYETKERPPISEGDTVPR